MGFRDKIAPGYFQVGDLYRVCQTDWPEYCVGALLENYYISFIVLGRLCIMHMLPYLIKLTDGH